MIILLLKFISFLPLSILRVVDRKKDTNKVSKIDRFGIEAFVGLAGEGKTISMTRELNRLRKKYGNDIYITTNYFYKYQDFPFENWHQLLNEYDKTLIVAWDELPNEFNSRDFQDFPVELVDKLTQLRKENGTKIFYTAQDFKLVDVSIRRLTFYVHQCRTFMERLTYYHTYEKEYYEQYINTNSVDRKSKIIKYDTKYFFQNEYLRSSFDSFKTLKSAKSKQYINRSERAALNNKII